MKSTSAGSSFPGRRRPGPTERGITATWGRRRKTPQARYRSPRGWPITRTVWTRAAIPLRRIPVAVPSEDRPSPADGPRRVERPHRPDVRTARRPDTRGHTACRRMSRSISPIPAPRRARGAPAVGVGRAAGSTSGAGVAGLGDVPVGVAGRRRVEEARAAGVVVRVPVRPRGRVLREGTERPWPRFFGTSIVPLATGTRCRKRDGGATPPEVTPLPPFRRRRPGALWGSPLPPKRLAPARGG